jgi:Mycothiol maleylpyruvate isomerase N-terminal domain
MLPMTATTARSQEAEAFLDTLQDTPPGWVTACEGWTTHEITAHLAGNAAEISRHLRPYLLGEPVPATQSFEVREAPFRAMDDTALRRSLEDGEEGMRSLIDQVLAREPGAVIPWTGRQMAVAKFIPHMRNEFALHRWDVTGDCDTSTELLAQPELTTHSVTVLGRLLVAYGATKDPQPREDFAVRLRSEGAQDVRVVAGNGQATLELPGEDADEPYAEVDPAARALVIWGRRPDQRGRFRSHMPTGMLARLQALLSGY